ncbi:hypothetical protein L798_02950 [Zootermopsis nevadensis]|uniref:Uncharacterized protein n=1 Tax=Zootermopsis nevadensis TaxID=136037 RepID=A0A067QGS9_ZOONE|nr:hypothetical protein L798_02950 [Zootermopsis nevadensis]
MTEYRHAEPSHRPSFPLTDSGAPPKNTKKMISSSHRPSRQKGIKMHIARSTGRPTTSARTPAKTLPRTPQSGLSSRG